MCFGPMLPSALSHLACPQLLSAPPFVCLVIRDGQHGGSILSVFGNDVIENENEGGNKNKNDVAHMVNQIMKEYDVDSDDSNEQEEGDLQAIDGCDQHGEAKAKLKPGEETDKRSESQWTKCWKRRPSVWKCKQHPLIGRTLCAGNARYTNTERDRHEVIMCITISTTVKTIIATTLAKGY